MVETLFAEPRQTTEESSTHILDIREHFYLGKFDAAISASAGRLAKYSQGASRQRRLTRAYYQARLTLGERMFRSGIDDGHLCAEIDSLDKQISEVEAAQAPSRSLKFRRRNLILQLADLALAEDAPLPGAEVEYDNALQARVALTQYAAM